MLVAHYYVTQHGELIKFTIVGVGIDADRLYKNIINGYYDRSNISKLIYDKQYEINRITQGNAVEYQLDECEVDDRGYMWKAVILEIERF